VLPWRYDAKLGIATLYNSFCLLYRLYLAKLLIWPKLQKKKALNKNYLVPIFSKIRHTNTCKCNYKNSKMLIHARTLCFVIFLPCLLSCYFDDPNCPGSGLENLLGLNFIGHQQNSYLENQQPVSVINGKYSVAWFCVNVR